MLNLYGLSRFKVLNVLLGNKINAALIDNQILVAESNEQAAQDVIDTLHHGMPNLDPVQFGYLLARYKFKDVIIQLLENIRVDDEEKYAIYDAYLSRSKYYEFTRALYMFNEIRQKFIAIDPRLNFTDEQLKQMWLEASQV